jgi:hypothetical protein
VLIVTHAKYSVKCVWGLELSVGSILIAGVSHITLLASIVFFRCDFVPNLVLMTNNFTITMWF